jgi:hypothetical protein
MSAAEYIAAEKARRAKENAEREREIDRRIAANGQNAQGKRQNISLPKRPGEPDRLLLNSRNLKLSPRLRSRSRHSSLPVGMPPLPKREKLKREPCAKCRKKPRQNKLPRRINLLKFGVLRNWLPKSPNGSEKK